MVTVVESDSFAGDSRRPTLRRVSAPFHRIAATYPRSPWLAGVIATALDTQPLRQCFLLPLAAARPVRFTGHRLRAL